MRQAVVDLLRANADHSAEYQSQFGDVQESQRPEVVTVCCSDSRVLQDKIWGNTEPGNMFTCSNIGNRVVQKTSAGDAVSGDVLYPIQHTGTESAIVVGHTGCGAVTAAYQYLTGEMALSEAEPGIGHCIEIISSRLSAGVDQLPSEMDATAAINRLVEYNVDRQVEFLRESESISDGVDIIGTVYDFQDIYSGDRGKVQVINIDGETDVETLRDEHPDISPRINRLWDY